MIQTSRKKITNANYFFIIQRHADFLIKEFILIFLYYLLSCFLNVYIHIIMI